MNFTAAQLRALEQIGSSRLTVVRAGPGSGKTRVFVEALRRELSNWNATRAGIAALSFTNVAHEVITQRLGGAPAAPHFVGTLDAFFWRFVVRPFGHLAGVTREGPVLVPAPLDESLLFPTQKFGPGDSDHGSIFKIAFVGGSESAPELFQRDERLKVVEPFRSWNLKSKRAEWAARGRVTHSDSQYLASCILNGAEGARIVDLLARRFPFIVVDEFQDTGWFLSRALLALLRTSRVRGAVVGDPDQAIYGFGGAHRGLFSEVECLAGAVPYVLEESHRCRRNVAFVASSLSRSSKQVVPAVAAPHGRAILLVHKQETPLLKPLLARVSELIGGGEVAVLARKGSTVRRLNRKDGDTACPWQSGAGRRLSRAVDHLFNREPAVAARFIRRELGDLLLDDEIVSNELLQAAGLPRAAWRAACHAVLMEAAAAHAGETWDAWLARIKVQVGALAARLGRPVDAKKLGSRFKKARKAGDAARPIPASADVPGQTILTVHQAKGREFKRVLYYVPKPHAGHTPCPSVEWWSASPDSEEREVAFVACSRAEEVLVLAVHKRTYNDLKANRRAFYDCFEVHELQTSAWARPRKNRIEMSTHDEAQICMPLFSRDES